MIFKLHKHKNILFVTIYYFFFVVIIATIASDIYNNIQSVFSQLNSPSSGISNSGICTQSSLNSQSNIGSSGCPTVIQYLTNTNFGESLPSGCLLNGGAVQQQTSNLNCPNNATTGPTYTESNGCKVSCPTNTNNVPKECNSKSSLTTSYLSHIKVKPDWQ